MPRYFDFSINGLFIYIGHHRPAASSTFHWRTQRWPEYAVAYPKPVLFYLNDFFNLDLIKFKLQINNYIGDSRHGNNFKCLTNHGYLSVKLVQTERNKIYDMIYNLLKLVIDFSKK